ncbi:hypothetical protein FRB99_008035 [Tulasnella sp. 403]|nr:hypothetical protein FRB99_008035 [Tulasnella sp. 403]
MATYADITARNASGPQPRPDPALLNTQRSDTSLPDVDHKVTIVPTNYDEHPMTETSVNAPPTDAERQQTGGYDKAKRQTTRRKDEAKKHLREAEQEGLQLWAEAKERLLRPATLGGIVGLVNVGLIGAFGYNLYSRPAFRSDTHALATAGVAGVLLFGAEGYIAEAYRNTAAGQEEERKAREEGATIYKRTKDIVLRPGVLGGLVGVVNVGILGGVGYVAYRHWDQPKWDRRTVSAVTVGLLTLFTGEGFLAEEYTTKEYPKRK